MAASAIPTFPIKLAKSSSFNYRGVGSDASYKVILIFPLTLCSPTAHTTTLPIPSIIFVPEIKKQVSFLLSASLMFKTAFSYKSLSPVNIDSSQKISCIFFLMNFIKFYQK